MTKDRSGIGVLLDTVASLYRTRVVLLCFTLESLSQGDAAAQFLYEVSNTFAGLVAVSCPSPEAALDLGHEFVVAGTITLALFVGGREVARSVGGGGETMMRMMIERHAGTSRRS
jgi:hypothetical protein